ncbi:MAG: D-methionine transport system permease protein [Thermosediminibacterales bacterium]|nr:D-methionine transport system permease protein [Thermosediminibacterales bacterium]MDK2836844.1 D-methionine transport system permease protein [Thermosediminibacterales bacterium]
MSLLIPSVLETVYMVTFSTIIALLIGFPLGIILVITEKGHICEMPLLNKVLSTIINVCRSVPYIILMIVLLPVSRWIIGTSIGTTASIVPLSIAAAPFVARIIESSLKEIEWGKIEAALSMGASTLQIIFKVMIPETLPSLVLGITITVISVLGYSAMAGAIGGGGLGSLAIIYGYQRFDYKIMNITLVILIIMVQIIQSAGNGLAKKISKNR